MYVDKSSISKKKTQQKNAYYLQWYIVFFVWQWLEALKTKCIAFISPSEAV